MKITFVIKAINAIAGGAERVLCVIASTLAERGHDVTLVSFDHVMDPPFYALSPKVHRVILGCRDPRHQSTLTEIITRKFALRREIKKLQPDIVIGFMHSIFIPLAFALAGTKIPVIASEHIVPQYYRERRIEFLALCLSAFFVKKITVLSGPVARLYPKFLWSRMAVMPNPVIFPAAVQKEKRKLILNVGRLDPQKDQKTLISAFALLAPKFPEWNLRIVGEGPLEKDLKAQVFDLGLTTRIEFPGKNPRIEEEYAAAEIFAIPSLYESFGLATAEALACRVVAIGFTDCPGTNEIILDGRNGLLVSPTDRVGNLTAGLRKLMEDTDLRKVLGDRGPATLSAYHPDVITTKWEELIRQVVNT